MEYLLAYLNESTKFQFGRLFSFKGILDRESYFLGLLAWAILVSLVGTPLMYLSGFLIMISGSAIQSVFAIVAVIFVVVLVMLIWQALAAMARRLHDAGKSAHYLWFWLLPFIGPIVVLWQLIKPTEQIVDTTKAEA